MSSEPVPDATLKRPIPPEQHPLWHRTYRVATPAIADFHALAERCLRYRIPGAMIYGRPRLGKTYAIEYVRLLLAKESPDIPTFYVQSEHKVGHSEGSFFTRLLRAVGHPDPEQGRNSLKRRHLTDRMCQLAGLRESTRVVFLCDEAQRYTFNEYEWLRDVHDECAQHAIRLTTFLVGQPQLRAQKVTFQVRGDEQIVARFMVDELQFYGIRSPKDAATCLAGYDKTEYPADSGWSFTRFFVPKAFAAGLRLADEAKALWHAFAEAHHASRLASPLEIPMDFFTRAVEIALMEATDLDAPDFRLNPDVWRFAVKHSGYVTAQRATKPPGPP